MSFTEDNYEKAVIALFEQMGYRHLYGPDIERDYYVPFYEEQLLLSLANLNRGKPQAALQEAVGKLKDIDTGSLAQKNERFMDYLQHGIEVSYFDGRENIGIRMPLFRSISAYPFTAPERTPFPLCVRPFGTRRRKLAGNDSRRL